MGSRTPSLSRSTTNNRTKDGAGGGRLRIVSERTDASNGATADDRLDLASQAEEETVVDEYRDLQSVVFELAPGESLQVGDYRVELLASGEIEATLQVGHRSGGPVILTGGDEAADRVELTTPRRLPPR